MKKYIFLFFSLVVITCVFAQQKKSLTHEDYDLWKTLKKAEISKNGNVIAIAAETVTERGDGYLRIYNARTGNFAQFFNGSKPKITDNEQYVVFVERPAYDVTREERKKEVKKEAKAKDKLFIYNVAKNILVDSFPNVKSFKMSKQNSDYLLIEVFKKEKPKKDSIRNKEKKDSLKYKDDIYKNDFALIYSFKNAKLDTLRAVKDFVFAKETPTLFYTKIKAKKKGDKGIYNYDFVNHKEVAIDTGKFAYDKLTVSKQGKYLGYVAAADSTSKDSLKYQLYLYHEKQLTALTDSLGKNLKKGWEVNGTKQPYFSKNTQRLYFYTNPEKKFNVITTLLKDEIPEVDVWTYQDKLIQPEQKVRLKELQNKGYLSYLDLQTNKVVNLQDEFTDALVLDDDREQEYIVGYATQPYDLQKSWDSPQKADIYSINTKTGKKRLAAKGVRAYPRLSTKGNYVLYFDPEVGNWWSVNLETLAKQNLTAALQVPFYDVENDVPALAGAYGLGGFDKDGNALLYDQFDVWKVNLKGGEKPQNITRTGRKDSIVFRALHLDKEHRNNVSYYKGKLLFTAFNKKDKTSKLYALDLKKQKMEILLAAEGKFLNNFAKAPEAAILLYRKQDFTNYPDFYLYNDTKQDVRLTNANPQQKDFKWGTVSLFRWTAFDGTDLEGLLYKPENFDANKKYPVMIYFYEKYSDKLKAYWTPKPSASIVNMSYLVSNDYIVFVPDVVYKKGHPGESAYNCIVSGAEAVRKLPYVDAGNMAIQGQSWGGYQVAYLVTRTNMFKAAMAGAPVSNMTSAYGGIRWKSGLSREFQYEKTQSRIGKTLWEGFDLYVENSPLFGIPKIETPLLMMHNDQDGAVPYYQGIEMFMGMRRLGKPAWLLVYNNEQHNLKKMKNKQDLSIRMMQFFNHYLKDAPAPKWMKKGVSAVEKGKDLGYELEK